MMNIEYNAYFGLSGDNLGLGLEDNLALGLEDNLSAGLNNLYLDDFSASWGNELGTDVPLTIAGGELPQFGFDDNFVQLPFLGGWQQNFAGLDDSAFGSELGPEFLRDFQTYPVDPDAKDQRLHNDRHRHHKRHKHKKRDRRGDGVTPRADGPGYYDTAHYDSDRSSTPIQQQSRPCQSIGSPPSEPPAPPPVPSSAASSASSHSNVAGPDTGGPPDADEVASHSSHSSAHSSVSSHSSQSSSATPVNCEPERPQERGRCTQKKTTPREKRRDHHNRDHPRRRSPDDLYRVERARGISPHRNPPSYDEYERFYRRPRSPSPGESITTRSSSADSSIYQHPVKTSKLFKAASKCTADYLTRLKIHAPCSKTTPPWVKAVSDMFFSMGFTIVDCVFEQTEGIVTILAPPELVAREIGRLPPHIRDAITSIRAARVCRKNGRYDLQVW